VLEDIEPGDALADEEGACVEYPFLCSAFELYNGFYLPRIGDRVQQGVGTVPFEGLIQKLA